MAVWVVLCASFVFAQDPDVIQIEVSRDQHYQWTFGPNCPDGDYLAQAEAQFRKELDFVHRACELTDSQQTKLELAGRGDVHHFFNRFDQYAATLPSGMVPVDEAKALRRSLFLCAYTLRFDAGLHGPSSMLRKSLRATLDERQWAAFETALAARREDHYRQGVAATFRSFSRSKITVSLTPEQQQQVADLLVRKTECPDSAGGDLFVHHCVMHALSHVPEEELLAIVGEDQWPSLSAYIEHGRTYADKLKQVAELGDETPSPVANR